MLSWTQETERSECNRDMAWITCVFLTLPGWHQLQRRTILLNWILVSPHHGIALSQAAHSKHIFLSFLFKKKKKIYESSSTQFVSFLIKYLYKALGCSPAELIILWKSYLFPFVIFLAGQGIHVSILLNWTFEHLVNCDRLLWTPFLYSQSDWATSLSGPERKSRTKRGGRAS